MTGSGDASAETADAAVGSRISIWLLAIGLGVPLALILRAAALFLGVRSARHENSRRSAVALILQVVLAVVALDPVGFISSCNHNRGFAVFSCPETPYDRLSSLPNDQRPRLVVFD
jgi:hypothetical protein